MTWRDVRDAEPVIDTFEVVAPGETYSRTSWVDAPAGAGRLTVARAVWRRFVPLLRQPAPSAAPRVVRR